MTDLFELPPDEELPPDVHASLRRRVLGRTGPGSSAARSSMPPARRRFVAVAAGLSAGVTVVAVLLASLLVRPAAPPAGGRNDPGPDTTSGLVTPTELYAGQVGSAPAGTTARCLAAAHRPGAPGLSDGQWKPLLSASAPGVVVAAYAVGSQRVFCETTPATVTLSAPAISVDGAPSRLTFFSPLGTAAGVTPADTKSVSLFADGAAAPPDEAMVGEGAFIIPNAFRADTTGIVLTASGPKPSGSVRTPIGAALAPGSSVVDVPFRPRPKSPAAGELDKCLRDTAGVPVPDPTAWRPGAEATLPGQGVVSVASYRGLVLVCRSASGTTAASRLVRDGRPFDGVLIGSRLVTAAGQFFYNFRSMAGGGYGSDTIALAGAINAPEATTVVIRRAGTPDLTSPVLNGTFLFARIGLNAAHPGPGDEGELLILGRSGTVLEKVQRVQL